MPLVDCTNQVKKKKKKYVYLPPLADTSINNEQFFGNGNIYISSL